MRKTIILSISLLIVASLSFSSCATLFGKKSHALAVGSDPAGAEVYVNGFKMGTTPVELNLKADKSYTIEYRKEGYQNVTRIVNTRVGAGWIVLDVLGGLIPIVVDAATGNWNKLDQDAVNAVLEEQQ
ncbi:PEGA domain protein [Allomuricauda ruestringensis DSM 13258]|uniref:PEGA domain protein n=1 Tax=Allomuricauda ruestringensis (strain DSM 13258 / CIP 107369 / LMG 19739 / B1) TaxID=886377 RepID=G2PQ94_ALLRU|nr:PEGA domain-containing protein [Allomuricauda ruestringensis]AEM71600.1 PEGA domain protein [Allomuricauda ruestringensis DSM 13258]